MAIFSNNYALELDVKIINKSNNPNPSYSRDGDSGMDISAFIPEKYTIFPEQILIIPTGIYVKIPKNYEFQVRPRSGLAAKHGITVLNTPGTIDSNYTGEIKIILKNTGEIPFNINNGDRIAQIVLCPVIKCTWDTVDSLEETNRNSNGFGSSGI
jgi:dUTP pyrophosphatase